VDSDVDTEIRYHLEQTERELRERGLTADEARNEALRRFGDVDQVRASLGGIDRRGMRQRRWHDRWLALWQDAMRTARSLRREPALVATTCLTLALGIGVNATMFGIVDRLLLRPPPHVRDDGSLSRLFFQQESEAFGRVTFRSQSYPAFDALRANHGAFADLAAHWETRISLGTGASARSVDVVLMTPNLFTMLGVAPRAGRFFPNDEWITAAEPTAVVTESFADREFGSAEGALGRTIELEKQRLQIIGVTPRGFSGVDPRHVDLFLTMATAAPRNLGKEWRTNIGMRWLTIVARRATGVGEAQAGQMATASIRAYGRENKKGDSLTTALAASIIPARTPEGSVQGKISLWLAGVSFLVLLVACANVANLLLARTLRRQRELAMHLALGIDRRRLSVALVTEGVLLALLAGSMSLLAARWSGDLLRATLLREYGWEGSIVDARLMAYTLIASVIAGVLAGLVPVSVSMRMPLLESLRAGARDGGGRRSGLRSALIVLQGGLTVVLLVGAGLFVRSFAKAATLDLGYNAPSLIVATPDISGIAHDSTQFEGLWEGFVRRIAAIPGVVGVSQSVTTPFESQWNYDIVLPDRGTLPPLKGGGPFVNAVSPSYMRTMGMRLTRGRDISVEDKAGSERIVVINEAMAKNVWPGEEPIGKCFHTKNDDKVDAACLTVVGVVADARITSLTDIPPAQYFTPLTQWHPDMRAIFVRVKGSPDSQLAAVRRAILAEAPSLPFTQVRPLNQIVDSELRTWRMGATLFGLLGSLGLLVAAIGLYSVIAHDVTQRRREIGVRVALGARATQVASLVMRDGLRYGSLGLALGLLIAVPASARVSSLLFETSPREPSIYLLAAGVLMVVAVAATLIPARRAVRVDTADVLRDD
jgi:predicted permease